MRERERVRERESERQRERDRVREREREGEREREREREKWSGVDGELKEMEMLTKKEVMTMTKMMKIKMAIGLKNLPQLEEGSSLIWW